VKATKLNQLAKFLLGSTLHLTLHVLSPEILLK